MGDVLCGHPAYYALREKYPDAHFAWRVFKDWSALVPKTVNEIQESTVGPYGGLFNNIVGYDLIFRVQPMWRHHEWETNKLHMPDLIAKWCGVFLKPEHRTINIELSDQDFEEARSLKLPEKFITVCSSPHYSANKVWPMEQRESIVRGLMRDNYQVVSVGGKDGRRLGNSIPGFGLSLKGSLALIGLSKGYIGPDCGTSWLACAAHKTPKVIVIEDHLKGKVGPEECLSDGNIADIYMKEFETNKTLRKLYSMIT